jgi:hypothetical protein
MDSAVEAAFYIGSTIIAGSFLMAARMFAVTMKDIHSKLQEHHDRILILETERKINRA